jgi:hypothetical protein
MTASQSNKFGFKRLCLENWLRVDPVWDAFGMSESSEAWVHDLLKADLDRLAPEFTLSVYVTFAIRAEPVESLAGPRALAMLRHGVASLAR